MTTAVQRVIGWCAVALWMALIFVGSTDLLSDQQTSRFLGPLLRWLFPDISDATIEILRAPIRKAGHLTEYAVLASLILAALHGRLDPRRWEWQGRFALLAVALASLYAVTDEWHQSWVPTRQGSAWDVVIDSLGASLAVMLWWGRDRWARRAKPSPAPNPPTTGPD